jgi:hypothetical protein
MTSKELTEQGITALKEGDKSQAHDLLSQAVGLDPNNAKAWFFLYRTQTSTADKRASLEKVLEIMPDNKPAREALERLDSGDEDLSEFEDDEPVASGYIPPSTGAIGSGTKPKIGGFQIPVAIPDAPAVVEPQIAINEFIATFKNGIEILRRTPGVYPMEIQQATWWRFWQFAVIAWIISGIASTLAGAILQSQLAATFNSSAFAVEKLQTPGIFTILISAILSIPIGVVVLYAGLYASHRFITGNRNGQGSFVAHSYAIILPVVTASLISNVTSLVLSFAPLLSVIVSLALLVLLIYSLYIAGQGLAMVHKVDNKTGYWTMFVLIAVQFVTGLLISIILGPILLTSGMAFI